MAAMPCPHAVVSIAAARGRSSRPLALRRAGARREIIEVGRDAAAAAPSCPRALPRGLAHDRLPGQGRRRARHRSSCPQTARSSPGRSRSASPTAEQIDFFDENLGGAASARLTILRRGKKLFSRVTGQSPVEQLAAVLRADRAVPARPRRSTVKKGYVVALTVPTWAPALTSAARRRQLVAGEPRRRASCDDTDDADRAADARRQRTQYRCLYRRRG